jgi:hypothetical protein
VNENETIPWSSTSLASASNEGITQWAILEEEERFTCTPATSRG